MKITSPEDLLEYDTLVAKAAERDRFNDALTKIRTENLSRFDCILIAAEAQGFFK